MQIQKWKAQYQMTYYFVCVVSIDRSSFNKQATIKATGELYVYEYCNYTFTQSLFAKRIHLIWLVFSSLSPVFFFFCFFFFLSLKSSFVPSIMPPHRAEIPTVMHDLPVEEALGQMLDSLEHLNKVCTNVFERIAHRVKFERGKIGSISERVSACQARVEKISQNPSKATTVYSTTKYPTPDALPHFTRLADVTRDDPNLKLQRKHVTVKDRRPAPPVNSTTLFRLLTGATREAKMESIAEVTQADGLGRLPSYLPSISSVLLFNSAENPYKEYVSLNNLEGVGGTDRAKAQQGLADAPITLVEGANYTGYTGGPNFVYTPELTDLPTFDLPQNLPLGQLADIQFAGNEAMSQSIAPSLANLPGLPSGSSFLALEAPKQRRTAPKDDNALSSSGAPPPPPSAPAASAASSSIPAPPPAVPAAPAAPVAPPAPAIPGPPGGDGTVASAPKPSADGGRSDLMASIRAAKNKKLRSAAEAKKREKPKKQAAAPSGDIMSHLRNVLQMRRKATSGKTDDGASSPKKKSKSSTSASIPSLPSLDAADADTEEFADEDWE
jgi:WAS protein family homolog 1